LVKLINAGADVHAVSDVAREYSNEGFWKAALKECGYNADEVTSWFLIGVQCRQQPT
jgi:hypothetical protein